MMHKYKLTPLKKLSRYVLSHIVTIENNDDVINLFILLYFRKILTKVNKPISIQLKFNFTLNKNII